MIFNIAYTLIFGKPLIFYFGIAAFLSISFTALIGILNFRGNHIIPFKWHPIVAVIALTLAVIHALMGLSVYLGF